MNGKTEKGTGEKEMRKCPHCARDIQLDALICEHCRSDVELGVKHETEKYNNTSEPSAFQHLIRGFFKLIGMFVLIVIGLMIVLELVSDPVVTEQNDKVAHERAILALTNKAKIVKDVDKGLFSAQEICRAAIATVMMKSPSIVDSSLSADGQTIKLFYVRASDGKKWKYNCKIRGDRVIWAMENGRWRSRSDDPKVTFEVRGERLSITEQFSDSENRQSFLIGSLK